MCSDRRKDGGREGHARKPERKVSCMCIHHKSASADNGRRWVSRVHGQGSCTQQHGPRWARERVSIVGGLQGGLLASNPTWCEACLKHAVQLMKRMSGCQLRSDHVHQLARAPPSSHFLLIMSTAMPLSRCLRLHPPFFRGDSLPLPPSLCPPNQSPKHNAWVIQAPRLKLAAILRASNYSPGAVPSQNRLVAGFGNPLNTQPKEGKRRENNICEHS